MFYCQHVLGMGHFIRSMEIVRGLKDFEVLFLNGGEIIKGFEFPKLVEVVNLHPLKSDAGFKDVQVVKGPQSFDEIKETRTNKILSEFERFKPDILIIELFPFGRRKFAFELIPLLTRVRLTGGTTKVVCSLRDILVSKRDQARHEDQVCTTMNRYFDLLLIHSDPKFQKLEETFFRVKDIKTETTYTGFVVQKPQQYAGDEHDDVPVYDSEVPMVLVSIGGGRVGFELLECVIMASPIVEKNLQHNILIFTGPYLQEDQFLLLQNMIKSKQHITLRRYTTDFLSYMEKADLSISMAGYNTCMNILTTGTKALVFPFTGHQNEEQTIRAEKLEALGIVSMIRDCELQPSCMAGKIVHTLKTNSVSSTLDIEGVEKTATCLKEMFKKPYASKDSMVERLSSRSSILKFDIPETELRLYLEELHKEKRDIKIFLRDDDIDDDGETLRQLFDVTLSCRVPLNLEIIPGSLTDPAIKLLDNYKHLHPAMFEFNQHGWKHLNHEMEGKKCEFGISRDFNQQFEDISRGKLRLEEIFADKFYPVFTPPWNRCTGDTFKALDQLGFKILSKDQGKEPIRGYSFQEISTTLDLYHWKGKPIMKTPNIIVETLICQMKNLKTIGILLHHKVMDKNAFIILHFFLDLLKGCENIKFCSFRDIANNSVEK